MIGLPKGSLEEATRTLFAKAGFKISVSSRSYRPIIDDPDLDGRLVRAQEISRYVDHGYFDCGLTGHDWILENDSDVVEVCELAYSKATSRPTRWVLAVPNESSVQKPEDLAGGDAAHNASELARVFTGEDKGPHRDALLMSTSLVLEVQGMAHDAMHGVELANAALDAGNAAALLDRLRAHFEQP